ncbi:hypothetical protein WN55_00320 [Dufourea novaeangliae]|uniref:Uncharacterized protein n=1 Tax=Dufourea novaeangliae TaxID=178035 RepID=A0A154PAK0_DUFNO|nr:hypothetical protein WN55_00320 [Dufourea novaeangliae]
MQYQNGSCYMLHPLYTASHLRLSPSIIRLVARIQKKDPWKESYCISGWDGGGRD